MALTKISGNVVQQNNFSLSGVVTATSFTGDLTGNVTGNVTGTATTATNLADGANITTGTISNDRLPATITKNLTGDVTGNLTGNVSSSGANTLGSLTVTNDATVGGALTVTGNLTVNGTTTTIDTVVTAIDSLAVDGDVTAGGNLNITGVSTFGGNIDLGDNDKLRFGAGYDLEIYSDGTNGIIKDTNTSGGDLRLLSDVVKLMNSDGTKVSFKGIEDGAAELYYNNSRKLETTGYGVAVSGGLNVSGVSTFQNNVHLLDNDRLQIGGSAGTVDGLEIYHDGSNSYIKDSGTGNLVIDASNGTYIRNSAGTENIASFNADGAVELYYDNSKKFETTGAGVTITGDARVTGILTVGQSSVTIDGTNNKITTPKLDYAGISSSISDTATDVFVYDTRKDSDGGAWRKRTQHTSWYNETLNTATRGSRREFPSVAVIVSQDWGFNIYDGDDPDMPMWASYAYVSWDRNVNSIVAKDGKICFTIYTNLGYSGNGFGIFDYVKDRQSRNYISGYASYKNGFVNDLISSKRSGASYLQVGDNVREFTLVNYNCNDVAMTVLPNAPIDSATGLPVPTIAVATKGGVSVIKDDGSVVSYTSSNYGTYGADAVGGNKNYWWFGGNWNSATSILAYNKNTGTFTDYNIPSIGGPFGLAPDEYYRFPVNTDNNQLVIYSPGGGNGINWLRTDGFVLIDYSNESTTNYLKCKIHNTFNTGWMHGDIKGAFLSDTDATNITAGNLVTNGTFDSNITNWSSNNGATLSHQNNGNPGGNINVYSATGSNGYALQIITTEVGKFYTLQFDHYHVDGSAGYVNIGNSLGGGQVLYTGPLSTSQSWTTYTYVFKAEVTSTYIGFYSRPGGNVRYDNISVGLAEADRSVNNKGLQVFGTVTKSAVATGAELVAYGPFSTSNRLQQPYNSDLDFGTGEFSVMLWFKSTASNTQQFVRKGDPSTDIGCFESYITNIGGNGNIRFVIKHTDGSSNTVLNAGKTGWNDGIWHHYVGVRRSGGSMELYLDGALSNNNTSSYSVTNASSILDIGSVGSLANGASDTYLSLVRISGSAPSDEQIKKIYEDEKVLFQENADCTLYGSSDAVTALAYDDSTNLLYAGTSSGRSDFQGLRRINNTTTAVTTAMSASNGLVAEQ